MGFAFQPTDRRRQLRAEALLAAMILIAAATVVLAAAVPARASAGPDLGRYGPGTIVVSQQERHLYLLLGDGTALRYPVAVGKFGKQWRGTAVVDGKYVEPAWAPPPEVKRAEPWLPDYIPGGSPRNPMGARALTLSGDQYAIHGTNRPGSIGTAASFGCIRMFNHDIVDLFERVEVGTPVVVTR